MKKWLPWILVAVFAAWFLSYLRPAPPVNGFNIAGYGKLPVLLEGRIQPLDSMARNALLSIRGKSTLRTGSNTFSATEWLLETASNPELADQRKIFRVSHPDLEGLMGAQKPGLEYYSYNDLTNQLPNLEEQAQVLLKSEEAQGGSPQGRTAYQKDLLHLYNSISLYRQIKNSFQPEDTPNFIDELNLYKESIPAAMSAALQEKEKRDTSALQRIAPFVRRYQDLAAFAYPLAIPPLPGQKNDKWENIGASLLQSLHENAIHPVVLFYATLHNAFRNHQPEKFNQTLLQYDAWLQAGGFKPITQKASLEFSFNRMQPFYVSMILYVTALLLGCSFWIRLFEPLRRSGVALLALGFVIHTAGLILRVILDGRPPVTNLYSSAVFIGWGAVLLGLILERFFKQAIGLVASAMIGFISLIIAHHLSLSGDTMQILRAVLDTNFWLATHVVTITIGYSSMFVAGMLAALYILRGVFTRSLTPEIASASNRMVYGIICFSTLFSFAGTVLGGIWADQSWGRFWGWDPKENGALLIVLWNAVTLHARWAGLIKERGLMAMAVFGNIVTSFSWFGVNMLGVGLHSYGFMDAAFPWLCAFIFSQLILIGLDFLPREKWASLKKVE